MTSRFAVPYPVLNGPHKGDRITAPPGTLPGAAVAVGWGSPKGMQYAVYVLVEIPPEMAAPHIDPEVTQRLGLAFMRSWPTPAEAQQHVREISLVTTVAREAAQSN